MVMAKEHLPLRLASATKLTSGQIRLVFETTDGEEHVVDLTSVSAPAAKPEPAKKAPVVAPPAETPVPAKEDK